MEDLRMGTVGGQYEKRMAPPSPFGGAEVNGGTA